jgi:hypothetical protein
VLLGTGNGTFQNRTTYAVGNIPEFLTVGDFNNDTKLDLVVANAGDNSISVLLGNGDGTFRSQTVYLTGSYPVSMLVGDFNNDKKLDVVVANRNGKTPVFYLAMEMGRFEIKRRIQLALSKCL